MQRYTAHKTVTNARSSSTTFSWEGVRISPPAEANRRVSRSESSFRIARREMRQALGCVIRFRGGAEAWFEIEARGCTYRFPGYVALLDAMLFVNAVRRG